MCEQAQEQRKQIEVLGHVAMDYVEHLEEAQPSGWTDKIDEILLKLEKARNV